LVGRKGVDRRQPRQQQGRKVQQSTAAGDGVDAARHDRHREQAGQNRWVNPAHA